MAPPPTKGSDALLDALARLHDDLKGAEGHIRELQIGEVRASASVEALRVELRRLEERVGALEAWRRGEEVSKGGIAFGLLKGGLPVAISLAALLFAVLSKAGC